MIYDFRKPANTQAEFLARAHDEAQAARFARAAPSPEKAFYDWQRVLATSSSYVSRCRNAAGSAASTQPCIDDIAARPWALPGATHPQPTTPPEAA